MSIISPEYKIVESSTDLLKSFFVRGVVFVEEQNCPYEEEFDEFDYTSSNFLGLIEKEPIACARVRLFKDYVMIERLAVRKGYRGQNIGRNMLSFVLAHFEKLGFEKIVLHAQSYLLNFYQDFGFIKKGESFIETNIEHYYMERIVHEI